MTTIQTLNKVVEIAEKRRDEALGALGQMQRELQVAQDQMDQLQAYAQEAEQRWSARSSVGVDMALLMHHRQFMAKIEHALDFQRGVLRERTQLIEHAQGQVHVCERDVAGLRKFTERKQMAVQHRVQRQDQKYTDEMALAIHLRQTLARAQQEGARP
jgi:flagellar FliJ protein